MTGPVLVIVAKLSDPACTPTYAQVPFANLAFAIPWMPKSKPAQWENALGLVLILAGLVTYRFWPLVSARLGCGGGARGSRQGESSGDDAESELIGSDEQ